MSLSLAAVIFMGGYVVVILAGALVMVLRPGGAAVALPPATTAGSAPGRRNEIPLGGEAESFGITRGRVLAVLLRSDTPRLQELALTTGLGLVEDGHVPAEAILSADGELVQLTETWAEPSLDGSGPPPIALRAMTVFASDRKRLGTLRLVCFDRDSGTVTHLVVAPRRSPAGMRLVPYAEARAIGPNGITTELKSSEWSALPTFATDSALHQAILDRLTADPGLQPFQRSLTVDVEDQRVRLRGYVTDRASAARAIQVAQSIPGVLGLESSLVADDDLVQAVRQALDQNAAAVGAQFQVRSRFGIVEIAGEPQPPATVARIQVVAARVQGVLSVRNGIEARQA